MGGFGDIYRTLFALELSVMFQYRAAVVIWLLGLVLQPVVLMIVWLTVARSRGGTVGDFDAGGIAAYFIAVMLVNHATFTWHMYEMGWRVRSGFFNSILVQPLHPWHRDVLQNVAYKVPSLGVMLPVAVNVSGGCHSVLLRARHGAWVARPRGRTVRLSALWLQPHRQRQRRLSGMRQTDLDYDVRYPTGSPIHRAAEPTQMSTVL